jgi:hypothetical protein
MGYLYHDRRVDHGIDGEIELVSPNGDALNLVIMVQSKASNRPHTFETADSFPMDGGPGGPGLLARRQRAGDRGPVQTRRRPGLVV